MPKIIIRADTPGDQPPLITLSEHLVAENLQSSHYAAQLIERISWAASDAHALEAHDRDRRRHTPPGDDARGLEATSDLRVVKQACSPPAAERAPASSRSPLSGAVEQLPDPR